MPEPQTADLPAEDLAGWRVLEAKKPLLDLRLHELWESRDLIYLFFKRDFVTSYKQTVLGPFWFFVQPVLTAVMFYFVFGRVAKVVTAGVPQFLFFMGGVLIWNFFSNVVLRTATTLSGNSGLFSKVYFPRMSVPLSVVVTNLVIFGVQLGCFLVLCAASWWKGAPVHPNWALLLLPALLVQTAALSLGVGCIVAALTTRYRDLALGVTFGIQLWMYASCVVIPLAAIGVEKQWLVALNPIVPIIETFRYGFLGYGVVAKWQLITSACVSFVLLVVGLIMFRRAEQTAMDTV